MLQYTRSKNTKQLFSNLCYDKSASVLNLKEEEYKSLLENTLRKYYKIQTRNKASFQRKVTFFVWILCEQVCIPVGCVPPAC